MTQRTFSEFDLSEATLSALESMGFTTPSPIQEEALPLLLEGNDAIGQAQTGTGKTAAFGIPLIEKIDISVKSPQGLILCPTRELAVQVENEIKKLKANHPKINSLAVYGGTSIDKQINALKRGVHIIVGTPGRVMDLMNRGNLKLNTCSYVVLDEADEMLDMGFREDIEFILQKTPEDKQTVFFSATMPKPILQLASRFLKDHKIIAIKGKELTVEKIKQYYIPLRANEKDTTTLRLLETQQAQLKVIFCNTKRKVDELVSLLQENGHLAEALHGDLSQAQRNRVMEQFRKGKVKILIATDVAARGIDVEHIELVINYDVPLDTEYYVHRIGRTGRAGRIGTAFSLVAGREMSRLKDIMRYTKSNIEKQDPPTLIELNALKRNKLQDEVNQILTGDLQHLEDLMMAFYQQGLTAESVAKALLFKHLGPEVKEEKVVKRKREITNIARLFLNVGKHSKISPGDILGAITGETGLPGRKVGDIDMYDKFSFVEVPAEDADKIVKIMNRSQIKGKSVNVEIAKGK